MRLHDCFVVVISCVVHASLCECLNCEGMLQGGFHGLVNNLCSSKESSSLLKCDGILLLCAACHVVKSYSIFVTSLFHIATLHGILLNDGDFTIFLRSFHRAAPFFGSTIRRWPCMLCAIEMWFRIIGKSSRAMQLWAGMSPEHKARHCRHLCRRSCEMAESRIVVTCHSSTSSALSETL